MTINEFTDKYETTEGVHQVTVHFDQDGRTEIRLRVSLRWEVPEPLAQDILTLPLNAYVAVWWGIKFLNFYPVMAEYQTR